MALKTPLLAFSLLCDKNRLVNARPIQDNLQPKEGTKDRQISQLADSCGMFCS